MSHLTYQLEYIRTTFVEMMELVKDQLEHAANSLLTNDAELAEEILRKEARVNALEINLEKECENTIALFQPVATELRFVMSTSRSIAELERLGDHAEFTARAVIDFQEKPFSEEYIKAFYYREMHDTTMVMFTNVIDAFEKKDTSLARHIFMMDKELNKIYKMAIISFQAEINSKNARAEELLMLYSICARLIRSSSLLTNLAEEIIFYIEAEVLKHKKMKQKMKEKKD
jgi:phosphate transport system protein